jgi:excisionase family DNA binding protein
MKAQSVAPVPRVSLTRQEAAQSLGVSLSFFAEHIQPQLKLVRLGSVRLVPLRELERWLEREAQMVIE